MTHRLKSIVQWLWRRVGCLLPASAALGVTLIMGVALTELTTCQASAQVVTSMAETFPVWERPQSRIGAWFFQGGRPNDHPEDEPFPPGYMSQFAGEALPWHAFIEAYAEPLAEIGVDTIGFHLPFGTGWPGNMRFDAPLIVQESHPQLAWLQTDFVEAWTAFLDDYPHVEVIAYYGAAHGLSHERMLQATEPVLQVDGMSLAVDHSSSPSSATPAEHAFMLFVQVVEGRRVYCEGYASALFPALKQFGAIVSARGWRGSVTNDEAILGSGPFAGQPRSAQFHAPESMPRGLIWLNGNAADARGIENDPALMLEHALDLIASSPANHTVAIDGPALLRHDVLHDLIAETRTTYTVRWIAVERPDSGEIVGISVPAHADLDCIGVPFGELLLDVFDQGRAAPTDEPPPDPCVGLINVNTADYGELQTITGIGLALAARIIQSREEVGPFATAGELQQRISGIGPATIEVIAPQLCFEAGDD